VTARVQIIGAVTGGALAVAALPSAAVRCRPHPGRHMDDVSAVGKAVHGDLLNICVWNGTFSCTSDWPVSKRP
jgi:hypothetical protein